MPQALNRIKKWENVEGIKKESYYSFLEGVYDNAKMLREAEECIKQALEHSNSGLMYIIDYAIFIVGHLHDPKLAREWIARVEGRELSMIEKPFRNRISYNLSIKPHTGLYGCPHNRSAIEINSSGIGR